MSRSPRRRDPLAPIEFITTVAVALLGGLVLGMMLLGAISHVTHPSWEPSFGAWGASNPCVEVPQQGLGIGTSGDAVEGGVQVWKRRPGVMVGVPQRFLLCHSDMSTGDRTLATAPPVLDVLWSLGFLGLVLRLVHRARRGGLFTHDLARGLQHLGWFVLGGWLVVQVVGATCGVILTSHLVDDFPRWAVWPSYWHWSWATIIGGFGLLTIARVIAETVPLREDVEATV